MFTERKYKFIHPIHLLGFYEISNDHPNETTGNSFMFKNMIRYGNLILTESPDSYNLYGVCIPQYIIQK